MELFVPGRVCLFGEHNDWAAEGRKDNTCNEDTYGALVVGTQQGIYARASKHPSKLVIKCPFLATCALPNKESISSAIEIDMNELMLEKEAIGSQSFFRCIAGVALQIVRQRTNHSTSTPEAQLIEGITLDIYKSDLPMKKGLSSSGAICVLTAQAFSKVHDLNLSYQQIMELAYLGEISTNSKCGRMDQVCIYGSNQLTYMVFNQNTAPEIRSIKTQLDLFYIIVDLGSEKDTVEILKQLQKSYRERAAEDSPIHKFFRVNRDTVLEAKKILEQDASPNLCGDIACNDNPAERLGIFMSNIQKVFDQSLIPLCPEQLQAPILHRVLYYPPIQHLIFGGKWIGSGGDGSLLLLTKDSACQQKVIRIIHEDLQLDCWPLTILK